MIGRPNRDPNARPQQGLKPPPGHTPQRPVPVAKPKQPRP